MNPAGLTPEDIEANPELGAAIVATSTAEHMLVTMVFEELGVWDGGGVGEPTGVHHDRFEYDGRDWFVLFNDSEEIVSPSGLDTPPGKARLIVDGTQLAKLHEDETGWMYDPDSGEPMNGVSVNHELAGGGAEGNATAKTWLLRTVEALRWRVADAGGYDQSAIASVETILDDSGTRLHEVRG